MHDKKITFFMLVTNRDCMIADYAISSYTKIWVEKKQYGYNDFVLFVYLNCLSEENKSFYLPKWRAYPFVTLYDNAEKMQEDAPYPGQEIISPEGYVNKREDYTENCDELWTTDLKKFNTPYIATVDADFEILNADFYFYLVTQLEQNKNYIGASSSYSSTALQYDTYSKRDIELQERNHTWFCIYRKEAFSLSSVSHFYYEEVSPEGKVAAFDSAAYFQHDLKLNQHFTFATAPKSFRSSFVHYGATSKNRSLNRKNIGLYRRVFMLANAGVILGKENIFSGLLNKMVRVLSRLLFGRYLEKFMVERGTYIYDEQAIAPASTKN
jgi:hypothetical protein